MTSLSSADTGLHHKSSTLLRKRQVMGTMLIMRICCCKTNQACLVKKHVLMPFACTSLLIMLPELVHILAHGAFMRVPATAMIATMQGVACTQTYGMPDMRESVKTSMLTEV